MHSLVCFLTFAYGISRFCQDVTQSSPIIIIREFQNAINLLNILELYSHYKWTVFPYSVINDVDRNTTKPTKRHMRPAKTQSIRLLCCSSPILHLQDIQSASWSPVSVSKARFSSRPETDRRYHGDPKFLGKQCRPSSDCSWRITIIIKKIIA